VCPKYHSKYIGAKVAQKMMINYDKFDLESQLRQHFMSSFCVGNLSPKNYKAKLQVDESFA